MHITCEEVTFISCDKYIGDNYLKKISFWAQQNTPICININQMDRLMEEIGTTTKMRKFLTSARDAALANGTEFLIFY